MGNKKRNIVKIVLIVSAIITSLVGALVIIDKATAQEKINVELKKNIEYNKEADEIHEVHETKI